MYSNAGRTINQLRDATNRVYQAERSLDPKRERKRERTLLCIEKYEKWISLYVEILLNLGD